MDSSDITLEGLAVKIAPPAAVSGAVILGMTPAQWITVLTLIYLLMSIGLLIPRYWAQLRDWRAAWKAARKAKKEAKENGTQE
ncbi:MAG: hypothetical protein RR740_00210 [Pseudomonas sp.]